MPRSGRQILLMMFILMIVGQACAADRSAPLIVAHRGLLRHAPENTLANFRACLELRLGFEFDVGQTQDGQLICIHDSTVDRTTNGTGKVSELTLKQIRSLDAGSWFDSRFAAEKVPTVEEVLELIAEYQRHDVLITVDLKVGQVGPRIVTLAQKHKVLDKLLFIGETIRNKTVRQQIRKASSKAATAAVANNAAELPAALNAADANWVYVRYVPSTAHIKQVHAANKRAIIVGTTVAGHEPKNWQAATSAGVDAILTDYALPLRTMFRKPDKPN